MCVFGCDGGAVCGGSGMLFVVGVGCCLWWEWDAVCGGSGMLFVVGSGCTISCESFEIE